MELILKNKTYKVDKILRAKNKIFNEAYEKIKTKADKSMEFNDDDLDLMVSTLVKVYDNQFTEEDINDDLDVADIIFNFMNIQIDIQSKLNKRIEQAKKSLPKGK